MITSYNNLEVTYNNVTLTEEQIIAAMYLADECTKSYMIAFYGDHEYQYLELGLVNPFVWDNNKWSALREGIDDQINDAPYNTTFDEYYPD